MAGLRPPVFESRRGYFRAILYPPPDHGANCGATCAGKTGKKHSSARFLRNSKNPRGDRRVSACEIPLLHHAQIRDSACKRRRAANRHGKRQKSLPPQVRKRGCRHYKKKRISLPQHSNKEIRFSDLRNHVRFSPITAGHAGTASPAPPRRSRDRCRGAVRYTFSARRGSAPDRPLA